MHRLPRLPTGVLLTLCERSGKKHLILQNPSRYSLEELNFLGDSPGFGSGIHMAPPGWSGFLWDSPLFCMGSSAILLRRHICLRLRACLGGSLLLSFRDPVFGRISSFPRLALPSESFPCSVEILRSPSLTYGKERQRILRFFF